MAQLILRRPWFLAALGLPIVNGDGELFLSSTLPASVSGPVGIGPGNVTVDCNPYDGTRYLTFGNGNGITSGECTASWDLHEIQLWDERGERITDLTASTATGHGGLRYIPDKAIDGDSASFFGGDHDIGMSCSCWGSHKKDGQSITLDMGSTKKVSKIMLLQGGAGNEWAVSKIRIHCSSGSSLQNYPLPLDISFGQTDIECNAGGCVVAGMDPAYYHTCDSAISIASSLYLISMILLGPALLS